MVRAHCRALAPLSACRTSCAVGRRARVRVAASKPASEPQKAEMGTVFLGVLPSGVNTTGAVLRTDPIKAYWLAPEVGAGHIAAHRINLLCAVDSVGSGTTRRLPALFRRRDAWRQPLRSKMRWQDHDPLLVGTTERRATCEMSHAKIGRCICPGERAIHAILRSDVVTRHGVPSVMPPVLRAQQRRGLQPRIRSQS